MVFRISGLGPSFPKGGHHLSWKQYLVDSLQMAAAPAVRAAVETELS